MIRYLFTPILLICSHLCHGQPFHLADIEVYGLRKVSRDKVDSALLLRKGDEINPETFSKEPIIGRLTKIIGVKHAAVDLLCCDAPNEMTLYIGIAETAGAIKQHRTTPKGFVRLPERTMKLYRQFQNEMEAGIRKGENAEDDSLGYALFKYALARALQLQLVPFATTHLILLTDIIHHSADARHRAAAADIIAVGNERKKIAAQLLYAIDDPDESVRNNAVRALGILIAFANAHKDADITVPAEPFINMVNSLTWTDKNKASLVLMHLSKSKDSAILKTIRSKAILSLGEMARWKSKSHAFFAFMIIGHLAGLDDETLYKKFSGDYISETDRMLAACCPTH